MNIGDIFSQIATKAAEPQRKREAERLQAENQAIVDTFLSRNGELFASFAEPRPIVFQKLGTFSAVHVVNDAPGVPDAVRAGQIADYALYELIQRKALTFALDPLPAEAQAQLIALRERIEQSGLIPPTTRPPVAAVAEGPTEADLDQAAIQEYRTTSTSDVKRHMRQDPAFNSRINKLMTANRI